MTKIATLPQIAIARMAALAGEVDPSNAVVASDVANFFNHLGRFCDLFRPMQKSTFLIYHFGRLHRLGQHN